jgi:hypothetical protein
LKTEENGEDSLKDWCCANSFIDVNDPESGAFVGCGTDVLNLQVLMLVVPPMLA